jgi:hypothetical protein
MNQRPVVSANANSGINLCKTEELIGCMCTGVGISCARYSDAKLHSDTVTDVVTTCTLNLRARNERIYTYLHV